MCITTVSTHFKWLGKSEAVVISRTRFKIQILSLQLRGLFEFKKYALQFIL